MSEPRTEAGKRLLDWLYLNGGAFRTEDRDHIEATILAIEGEAAMQSSPVDLRAALDRLADDAANVASQAREQYERRYWPTGDKLVQYAEGIRHAVDAVRAALRAVPAEAEEDDERPVLDEAFLQRVKAALRRMTSTALIPAGRVIYSGNIDQFALQLHDALRPADASGGGEGLDVVRLSQAFLRVNTFMDGNDASQAAGEIAAAYADLDPGRLASDSEPASESPGADSIATGKDD